MHVSARIVLALLTAVASNWPFACTAGAETPGSQWDLETSEGQIICRMLLTGDTTAHGRRIEGCSVDHAHWRAENDRLHVIDDAGFMSIHLWRTDRGHYAGDGRNKSQGKTFFAFRIGPNPASPPASPVPPPASGEGFVAALSGKWQYSKKGGREVCEVELTPQPNPFGGFEAKRGIGLDCTTLNLFHIRKWNMVGGQVVLTDAFNQEIARLSIRSNFLLRGGDVVMQR